MFFKILKVHGHSMMPTILDNQTVFVSDIKYYFTNPKVGDIVAFQFDKKVFIKRIKEIKNGMYFLIGDNNKDSIDSREFGLIERKSILGKIYF